VSDLIQPHELGDPSVRPAIEAGLRIIDAVREMLQKTVPGAPISPNAAPEEPDASTKEPSALQDVLHDPSAIRQYQLLALLAATIRWMSHETGREESIILEELAHNYRDRGS
jgi:hypothetical protein